MDKYLVGLGALLLLCGIIMFELFFLPWLVCFLLGYIGINIPLKVMIIVILVLKIIKALVFPSKNSK